MELLPRDKIVINVHKPSLGEKIFFLLSGMIMSVPFTLFVENQTGYFLSINLSPLTAYLLSVAFITPFVEEFAKAYPLFNRHGETERSIFSLGVFTGLGFGIVEFLLYVFLYGAPLLARIPAVIFHATSTSITAYGIATKRPFQFYVIAVFLHFLNNFFAEFGVLWLIGGTASIVASCLLFLLLYNKTTEKIIGP